MPMGDAYAQTYYHLIWATKGRQEMIGPEVQPDLYSCLRGKCDALGVAVHAVGGMADHVHLVCSIPPQLAVARCVEQIKEASSHYMSHSGPGVVFRWQAGYGVLTFSKSQLPRVVEYVVHQKEHHTRGALSAAMESAPAAPDAPVDIATPRDDEPSRDADP
ncbi:MAG TPA: IS200/IS605 family transposase [Armatimonadota bacterium]|jgi:putative transposase